MRFRLEGTNWEGRRWELSPGLVPLARQVDQRWPRRWATDGTVASEGHDDRNPGSDHRPRPFTGPGIVRALDAGGTRLERLDLLEELRAGRDPRIKYVIDHASPARLFSSYTSHRGEPPWEWRPYSPGGDSAHVHTSVLDSADHDRRPWELSTMTPDQEAKLDRALEAIAAVPGQVWSHGHDPATGLPPSPFQYLIRTKASTDRILRELGQAVDEAEIAALILETLTPAAIATAAVDKGVGEAVLDALRAELND